jgi:hypothetical protein
MPCRIGFSETLRSNSRNIYPASRLPDTITAYRRKGTTLSEQVTTGDETGDGYPPAVRPYGKGPYRRAVDRKLFRLGVDAARAGQPRQAERRPAWVNGYDTEMKARTKAQEGGPDGG